MLRAFHQVSSTNSPCECTRNFNRQILFPISAWRDFFYQRKALKKERDWLCVMKVGAASCLKLSQHWHLFDVTPYFRVASHISPSRIRYLQQGSGCPGNKSLKVQMKDLTREGKETESCKLKVCYFSSHLSVGNSEIWLQQKSRCLLQGRTKKLSTFTHFLLSRDKSLRVLCVCVSWAAGDLVNLGLHDRVIGPFWN